MIIETKPKKPLHVLARKYRLQNVTVVAHISEWIRAKGRIDGRKFRDVDEYLAYIYGPR